MHDVVCAKRDNRHSSMQIGFQVHKYINQTDEFCERF